MNNDTAISHSLYVCAQTSRSLAMSLPLRDQIERVVAEYSAAARVIPAAGHQEVIPAGVIPAAAAAEIEGTTAALAEELEIAHTAVEAFNQLEEVDRSAWEAWEWEAWAMFCEVDGTVDGTTALAEEQFGINPTAALAEEHEINPTAAEEVDRPAWDSWALEVDTTALAEEQFEINPTAALAEEREINPTATKAEKQFEIEGTTAALAEEQEEQFEIDPTAADAEIEGTPEEFDEIDLTTGGGRKIVDEVATTAAETEEEFLESIGVEVGEHIEEPIEVDWVPEEYKEEQEERRRSRAREVRHRQTPWRIEERSRAQGTDMPAPKRRPMPPNEPPPERLIPKSSSSSRSSTCNAPQQPQQNPPEYLQNLVPEPVGPPSPKIARISPPAKYIPPTFPPTIGVHEYVDPRLLQLEWNP
jgi:hypothetical protein